MTTTRQPRGIPVGGQFAPTAHTEPSVHLAAPTVAPAYVTGRLHDLGLSEYFSPDQVDGITDRLNESRDFSDRNISAVADELYQAARGYTAAQARDADAALQFLRDSGRGAQADAILAVTGAAGGVHPARHREPAAPPPDGDTIPVPEDDPRLQAGQVFNRVAARGQVFVHSSVSGYPQDTQAIRFQANRPLTDAEAYALSGMVGYANRVAIGGEPLDDPSRGPARDTPYSFIASIDTNKGRQGNFDKFEELLPEIIAEGSPVRPTRGGTRAIEAFGDDDLRLEIFYAE